MNNFAFFLLLRDFKERIPQKLGFKFIQWGYGFDIAYLRYIDYSVILVDFLSQFRLAWHVAVQFLNVKA